MLLPLRKGNEKGEQGRFPPRSVGDVPSIGCWSELGTLLGNFVGHFRRTSYDHRFLSSSSHSPPPLYIRLRRPFLCFFMNRVRPSVRVFPFPPPCRQPNAVRMDVEEVSRIILLLSVGKGKFLFFFFYGPFTCPY